jgi:hypothetical protein
LEGETKSLLAYSDRKARTAAVCVLTIVVFTLLGDSSGFVMDGTGVV